MDSNFRRRFSFHFPYTMLKDGGRAAMVVPDNVLFEGGAGEKIRRELLGRCDVHTLLRLPTGIWYAPGVKANVLFFDKKPLANFPHTREVWIYDLRSGRNFSIRQNPILQEHLTGFVQSYCSDSLNKRKESSHFRRFTYSEIMARDKANLDIQWSHEMANGAEADTPQALMKNILSDLEEAMREFAAAAVEINRKP
jgi:type I restriction enzyme M protein